MKLLNCLIAVTTVMSAYPAEASTFFCAATHSTGYKWLSGEWRTTNFATDNHKMTISETSAGSNIYDVKRLGKDAPYHSCANTLSVGEFVYLVCGGLGFGFVFNEKTLRFQEFYGLGYIDGSDTQENTPSLTIGTCSKLN